MVPVAVVEKGKQPGSHLLSGAVVNPRALRRLFRDRYHVEDMPGYGAVHGEAVYVLTRRMRCAFRRRPTMRNHGNVVFSLSQLGRWLGEQAEEGGAMILPETRGREAARLARPRRRDPHRRQGQQTRGASPYGQLRARRRPRREG